jgi:hypothetical protein
MIERAERLPSGSDFTLVIQLGPLTGDAGLLLEWLDANGRSTVCLTRTGGQPGELRFSVLVAADLAPLELVAPLDTIGHETPHELVLRHCGYRLDLLVDGVLLDEDWPLGRYPAATGNPRIEPTFVRDLAVWPMAREIPVSPDREECYLGPALPPGQGWKPRGHNVHVGDCMPFFHDGRLRIFYLRDRRQHGSMWGCGGHQWAQISTTDLAIWTEHPRALAIDAATPGSICTGSVFFHAGTYHAFHSLRPADGSPAPLCVATSTDGVQFGLRSELLTLPDPYDRRATRDPVVFRDETTGTFHLLATAALNDAGGKVRGCLAHLTSRDLRHWELDRPFLILDDPTHPECPDYFTWRGWHYLVFSLHGIARYRMSRQPLGPWEIPADDRLDPTDARVMKTAAFTGDRRLGVAFMAEGGGWGGTLCIRELAQRPDGTLATRWPAELPGR